MASHRVCIRAQLTLAFVALVVVAHVHQDQPRGAACMNMLCCIVLLCVVLCCVVLSTSGFIGAPSLSTCERELPAFITQQSVCRAYVHACIHACGSAAYPQPSSPSFLEMERMSRQHKAPPLPLPSQIQGQRQRRGDCESRNGAAGLLGRVACPLRRPPCSPWHTCSLKVRLWHNKTSLSPVPNSFPLQTEQGMAWQGGLEVVINQWRVWPWSWEGGGDKAAPDTFASSDSGQARPGPSQTRRLPSPLLLMLLLTLGALHCGSSNLVSRGFHVCNSAFLSFLPLVLSYQTIYPHFVVSATHLFSSETQIRHLSLAAPINQFHHGNYIINHHPPPPSPPTTLAARSPSLKTGLARQPSDQSTETPGSSSLKINLVSEIRPASKRKKRTKEKCSSQPHPSSPRRSSPSASPRPSAPAASSPRPSSPTRSSPRPTATAPGASSPRRAARQYSPPSSSFTQVRGPNADQVNMIYSPLRG